MSIVAKIFVRLDQTVAIEEWVESGREFQSLRLIARDNFLNTRGSSILLDTATAVGRQQYVANGANA